MMHKADIKREASASYTPVSWHHGKVSLLERITKGQIPLRYPGELVRELDSVMEFGLKLMHVGLHWAYRQWPLTASLSNSNTVKLDFLVVSISI